MCLSGDPAYQQGLKAAVPQSRLNWTQLWAFPLTQPLRPVGTCRCGGVDLVPSLPAAPKPQIHGRIWVREKRAMTPCRYQLLGIPSRMVPSFGEKKDFFPQLQVQKRLPNEVHDRSRL